MNERKTVVIIDDSSKVDFGGGQQITLSVAGILQNRADLIFVDYTSRSNYIKYVQKRFEKSPVVFLKSRLLRSLKIPVLFKKLFEAITLKLYFKANFNKLCKALPPDKAKLIIYTASKKGLTLANGLYKRYGIPYVFHAHLVERCEGIQFKMMLPYLKYANRIICVSYAVLSSYKNLGNTIMQYNPRPFNNLRKSIKNENHFVIAFVGGLIPIKGVEYFVEAAQIVDRSCAEFRIYGDGPLKYELERKAAGKVRFMGFCRDIINEMLHEIDVLVLPTIVAEALPTVIIEAKSVGIPVITTNLGGQAEIVKNDQDGFLVDIKDSSAIAKAVDKLIFDLKLYNEMACRSYESSKMFSPDKFQNTIIETLL